MFYLADTAGHRCTMPGGTARWGRGVPGVVVWVGAWEGSIPGTSPAARLEAYLMNNLDILSQTAV